MGFLSTLLKRFLSLFKKEEIKEEPLKTIEEPLLQKVEVIPSKPIEKITKFVNKNIIVRRIQNINFIFDKESSKEFESFSDDFHIIIVKDGYLTRKQKSTEGYITFFHRYLMQKEIDKLAQTCGDDIEVDHLYGKNDNRKSTLAVKSKKEHKKKHGREEEYWNEIENNRKKLKDSLR